MISERVIDQPVDSSDKADPANIRKKNSLDFICHFASAAVNHSQPSVLNPFLVYLLQATLVGSGNNDVDTAKACHNSAKLVAAEIVSPLLSHPNLLGDALDVLSKFSTHRSLHVRETVMICGLRIMSNNWPAASPFQKKAFKECFGKGLLDAKPEVQSLAMVGMTAYLALRSRQELGKAAEIFIKNCDILAAREKNKKKIGEESSSKQDDMYVTTISMTACLLLAFPYDMPSFLPSLASALVRHLSFKTLHTPLAKALQTFKRSHQDRWDEFKSSFTREQLDDLQGAGAANYFS